METINHECYVSLEVAKLLKEAGFDWKCNHYYEGSNILYYGFCDNDPNIISAPKLEVAQKWFREVKNIYIDIDLYVNKRSVTNSDGWTFHYEYDNPTFDCEIKNIRCETIYVFGETHDTYEEAQEAGIKKALEMILEKGE